MPKDMTLAMQDKVTKQDGVTKQNEVASPETEVRADGLTAAEAATQRKLKAVVLGLGVLIMLAFAGVIAGMVFRASQIGKGANGKTPASVAPTAGPATTALLGQGRTPLPFLPDLKLTLPTGSAIKSTSLNGQSLVVHHEGPAGAGITILDLTSGQIVSRVVVEPAASKP